jgi:hypothetical protein
MKRPEESLVTLVLPGETFIESTDDAASGYISELDKKFSREDVKKIVEWMLYLSTQE